MTGNAEEPIGTVDVWELHHFKAPIQRMFARHAIERLELEHYLRDLLATRRWDVVRAVPHSEGDGQASDHIYDVYGQTWSPTR
jgi:hypothetical protein